MAKVNVADENTLKKQTEASRELNWTDNLLANLEKQIAELKNRLSGVLRNETPPETVADATDQEMTPHAYMIHNIGNGIRGQIEHVEDIINRLEI